MKEKWYKRGGQTYGNSTIPEHDNGHQKLMRRDNIAGWIKARKDKRHRSRLYPVINTNNNTKAQTRQQLHNTWK